MTPHFTLETRDYARKDFLTTKHTKKHEILYRVVAQTDGRPSD
jgi:hypothetical protein